MMIAADNVNATREKSISNTNRIYIFLFVAYVLAYFFVYAFYGYNDADDGYTLALSWRIFNGEVPYRDFILVRPPFSPIFHTLTLLLVPANYQVIFERFLFYILIATYSLLGALIIDDLFDLKSLNINAFLLATVGFVLSTTCYTPMPWHTVDGLFFATIGIYLLVKFPSYLSLFLAITFLFLSALCKQSFYLMPFAGVIYVAFVYKNSKKTITAAGTLLLLLATFFLILSHYHILKPFVNLTTGSTSFKDFLRAGLLRYLNVSPFYIFIPILLWAIIKRFSVVRKLGLNERFVLYFFIAFTLIFPVFYFYPVFKFILQFGRLPFFTDELAIILFLISVFLLILQFKNNKQWITISILLLLAWSCSISWGDQTPSFFSVVLIFCFCLFAYHYFSMRNTFPLLVATLIISTLVYFIGYQKPIYGPQRSQLKYEMTDLFPKLSFIKINKERYDKYKELKLLLDKYGTNFKTLPGMPLTNYLSNTNSPIPIDWPFNAETNNQNGKIIEILSRKKPVVFIEKKPEFVTIDSSRNKTNCSIAYFVKTNWKKVDSTNYFDVYKTKAGSESE